MARSAKQRAASRKNLEAARRAKSKASSKIAPMSAHDAPGKGNKDSKWGKLAKIRKANQAQIAFQKANPGTPVVRAFSRPRYNNDANASERLKGRVGDGLRGKRAKVIRPWED